MENIEWKYIKKLKSSNAVEDFLSEKNIKLPVPLIEFIKKYNGGRPSKKLFNTEDGHEHVFKSLLSYNREDIENIYSVYPNIFENMNFYPLGLDATGNFVCYDRLTNKYVLLNHNTNEVVNILY